MAGLNYNNNSTPTKNVSEVTGSNAMQVLGYKVINGVATPLFMSTAELITQVNIDNKQDALNFTNTKLGNVDIKSDNSLEVDLSGKQDKLKFNNPKTGNVNLESDNSLKVDLSSYSTTSDISGTYLSKSDASSTYATKSEVLWTTDTTSTPNRLKPKTTGLDVEANAFYASSDVRLKDNIIPVTDESIDKVDKISIVEFDWKANDRHSVGIIAQEVQKELPYLVSEGNVLTVNYIPLLLLKIASLEKRVKELESKTF